MNMMNLIYHIARREEWQTALTSGIYTTESLSKEGFIHFSRRDQVALVANRFYAGQKDLILLSVDPNKLGGMLKYEAVDEEIFPHLYGALNIDAVVEVFDFQPYKDGTFTLPDKIV
jgi:uncharacterized protein (DUF952 family)